MLKQRPHRNLLFLPLLLTLAACGHNPLKTAQTVEQKGDALYGQYVIAKEQGAALLQDATIPDAAKRPIAEAMVASKQPADDFQDALIEYSKVKAQLAAGLTTEDKLLIASQNLDDWLVQAKPLIDKLIAAVARITR